MWRDEYEPDIWDEDYETEDDMELDYWDEETDAEARYYDSMRQSYIMGELR